MKNSSLILLYNNAEYLPFHLSSTTVFVNTTKVMPHEMYDERIRAHQPQMYSWESQPAEGVTLADLNKKHIKGCIRLGVEGGRIPASAISTPVEETLAKWKLLKNGVPTNGAAMLFSDNIDEFPQFRLRMARFVGNDKNEFIDNQRVEGGFFGLLDTGMAFFFKHLNLSGKITNRSLRREEQLEVPYKALREALINSLCHRQWEKYNLTNSIAIYDDRIEIANPGIFPPQITPESIKEPHESYPYNLKIAEALYKSTYLESWGSGAKRIMDACREQDIEEPVWRWDGGFVIVTFKRPKHDPSTTQVRLKYVPTTAQVQRLVELMGDEYMGMKEIMELFDLKSVKRFRENYIQLALSEGAIERLYPDLPNHPKQKYRLTDSAKEWKKNAFMS